MTNATIHPAMPFAEYLADPSPEPSLTRRHRPRAAGKPRRWRSGRAILG